MLVLSRRLNEKLLVPNLHLSIQVVAIKSGMVRLGIDAPPEVRVLREEVPDRNANWGPAPEEENDPNLSLGRLQQMLSRRLEIIRKGLREVQQQTVEEPAEASQLLSRIDEDLQLLLRRLPGEFEKIGQLAGTDAEEDFCCAGPVLRSR